MKIDINVCRRCKHYWGETSGGYRNLSRNSGSIYAICSYYVDTGNHRMSDFPSGRKDNKWMNECDKFVEYDGEERTEERKRINPYIKPVPDQRTYHRYKEV